MFDKKINLESQFKKREKIFLKKRHWVRLTRTCNNRCIFCLDKDAQDGAFIPLKDIRKDFARGLNEGIRRVVLSGGEPTLHPRFFEIIKLAKNLGYRHIQVISNGRMFAYKDFLDSAVNAGVNEVTFSIHGHQAILHDKQTQVRGSFIQSLTGLLNALKEANLIVNVDVVINKFNVRYLTDILKFFINLGVSEFDLLQVMPFGRAWDNKNSVFYELNEYQDVLRQAFRLSKNPNLSIWTNRFPAAYLEGLEGLIQHPGKLFDEVKGCRDMFEKFIGQGAMMGCWGKRCRYCCLEAFCGDLITLRGNGSLSVRPGPLCIDKGNRHTTDGKMFKFDRCMNVFEFLDFYLKKRFFVKSLRCRDCLRNQECQGAHIDVIRRKGFSMLVPLRKNGTYLYI